MMNCIKCHQDILSRDQIAAWGTHDDVAIMRDGGVRRLKIKEDLGQEKFLICASCWNDEDGEMIWDFECSGCQMQCQKLYPDDTISGGFGFKMIDGDQKTVWIATTYHDDYYNEGFDDRISAGYGSEKDGEIYKVSENWKQRIKRPGFNICDHCIDKYCEEGEFELIDNYMDFGYNQEEENI